jgi:hypothetical protein
MLKATTIKKKNRLIRIAVAKHDCKGMVPDKTRLSFDEIPFLVL